jgi:hypothetical protein
LINRGRFLFRRAGDSNPERKFLRPTKREGNVQRTLAGEEAKRDCLARLAGTWKTGMVVGPDAELRQKHVYFWSHNASHAVLALP